MFCELIVENCIACGLCQVYAPHFFEYDDEGIVCFAEDKFLKERELTPQTKDILVAYKKCPTNAIQLKSNP